MRSRKAAALAASAVMLASQFGVPAAAAEVPETEELTASRVAEEMGIGINLGNTMESCGDWITQWSDGTVSDYEKAWGSPIVTKEMIQGTFYADTESIKRAVYEAFGS